MTVNLHTHTHNSISCSQKPHARDRIHVYDGRNGFVADSWHLWHAFRTSIVDYKSIRSCRSGLQDLGSPLPLAELFKHIKTCFRIFSSNLRAKRHVENNESLELKMLLNNQLKKKF